MKTSPFLLLLPAASSAFTATTSSTRTHDTNTVLFNQNLVNSLGAFREKRQASLQPPPSRFGSWSPPAESGAATEKEVSFFQLNEPLVDQKLAPKALGTAPRPFVEPAVEETPQDVVEEEPAAVVKEPVAAVEEPEAVVEEPVAVVEEPVEQPAPLEAETTELTTALESVEEAARVVVEQATEEVKAEEEEPVVMEEVVDPAIQQEIEAMTELSTSLDKEQSGDDTTRNFFLKCQHVNVVEALQSSNKELQKAALQVVWKLSSRRRASVIALKEYTVLLESLMALGAMDGALACLDTSPTFALAVVNNLVELYSFDELYDLGVIPKAIAVMKQYPDDVAVLFVACDILYRATQGKRPPSPSKLAAIDVDAVSVLSELVDRFEGKDERIHAKAERTLESILKSI